MTTQLVTKITSITREATSGLTWLYEYGPDANNVNALRDLAMYEPSEIRPQYRAMKINGYCGLPGRTDSNGQRNHSIETMVKLNFRPLESDFDFLLIDNFAALRYGIQGYRKGIAGDFEGEEAFLVKSLRELNYQDRTKSPSNQIAVRVNVGGGRYGCPLTNPT